MPTTTSRTVRVPNDLYEIALSHYQLRKREFPSANQYLVAGYVTEAVWNPPYPFTRAALALCPEEQDELWSRLRAMGDEGRAKIPRRLMDYIVEGEPPEVRDALLSHLHLWRSDRCHASTRQIVEEILG